MHGWRDTKSDLRTLTQIRVAVENQALKKEVDTPVRGGFSLHSISERAQALELFKQGYGYKAVARRINVNTYTVRDWNRAFKAGKFTATPYGDYEGVEGRIGYYGVIATARYRRVLELKQQGKTITAIAGIMRLSVSTVRRYLNQAMLTAIKAEMVKK